MSIGGSAQVFVPIDPQQVWNAMKNFGDLSWSEGIDEVRLSGEGVGMVRHVRLAGTEDWVDEFLISIDHTHKKIEYGVDPGFAGVENYRASGQAVPKDNGCMITWQCGGAVAEQQSQEMTALMTAMAEAIAGLFAEQFQ